MIYTSYLNMAKKAARERVATKALFLTNVIKLIQQSLEQATDTAPSEQVMTSKLTSLNDEWDNYEAASTHLLSVGPAENWPYYARACTKPGCSQPNSSRQSTTYSCASQHLTLAFFSWGTIPY